MSTRTARPAPPAPSNRSLYAPSARSAAELPPAPASELDMALNGLTVAMERVGNNVDYLSQALTPVLRAEQAVDGGVTKEVETMRNTAPATDTIERTTAVLHQIAGRLESLVARCATST